MKNVISSRSLGGNNRCRSYRELGMVLHDAVNETMSKAGAEKTVLLNGLYGKYSAKQVVDELKKEYDEMNFATQYTRGAQEKVAAMIINRYLHSENRTPINPNLIPAKDIELPNLSSLVHVHPDAVFYNKDEIELVIYKTGRPTVTQGGKKRDSSAEYCLELYALWCYGREIAPRNKKVTVKASYYFLKRSDDQYWATATKSANFNSDFFAPHGNNMVYVIDGVYKDEDNEYDLGQLDKWFAPQIEEFEMGDVHCNSGNCEFCGMNAICNFKFAPVIVEKKKEAKPLSALTLSTEQEKAIAFHKGIARCNAGAGAGKTLVVALHVVSLIMDYGAAPESIICLTYTNAGAGEMRDRIRAYLEDYGYESDVADKICIKTFNAFCNDVVSEEYERLGFSESPRLIDDIERAEIIAKIVDNHHIDGMDYQNFGNTNVFMNGLTVSQKAFEIIKRKRLSLGDEEILKETLLDQQKALGMSLNPGLTQMLEAYEDYDKTLKANNLIEYADQSALLFDLLWMDRYYLEGFKFAHVIVDEFQDSNDEQLDLVKEIVNTPTFESLLVVGDDSQSIYSFQGANPKLIVDFFDEMGVEDKDRKEFFLFENHRSTPEILNLANDINRLNESRVDKDLIATRPSGAKPVVVGFHERKEEYKYIVEEIKKKIASGTRPEDIAFLGRNKNILQEVGSLLTEEGIQWVSLNPEPILENSKVIAAINLAKAIDNPQASQSVMIFLNAQLDNALLQQSSEEIMQGIDNLTLELTAIHDADTKTKRDRFIEMMKDIDFDADELYEDFITTLERRNTFNDMLDYINALEKYGARKEFKREKNYPGVVLTTAHSSKGLEWPVVFMSLTGFDTPSCHSYTPRAKEMREETRRLVFVSITRARDELYITGQFVAYGPKDNKTYDQFLKECFDKNGTKYDPIDHEAEKKAAEKAAAAAAARELRKREMKRAKEALENNEEDRQRELEKLLAED